MSIRKPPSQPWPVQANLIVHRCKESNPPNLFNIPSNEMKRHGAKWDRRGQGGIDLISSRTEGRIEKATSVRSAKHVFFNLYINVHFYLEKFVHM